MIWTIAQKEIRVNLYSMRFAIGFVLSCLVMGATAYVMVKEFEARKANYETHRNEHREALEKIKLYNQIEVTVDIPPSPVSIFSARDQVLPSSVLISPYSIPSLLHEDKGGGISVVMTGASSRPYNPLLKVFTAIDLGFVIRIVLSLVAVFLGFDAINGEKERRTLALLLSNPVSRLRLLAGKFIGGMVVLGVLLTAGFLLIALNLAISSDVNLNGSLFGELAVIWGASLFYLAVFLSLSLLISTLTHESSTSLVVLLLIWVLAVLIVPNGLSYLSGHLAGWERAKGFSTTVSGAREDYGKKYDQKREELMGDLGFWLFCSWSKVGPEAYVGSTRENLNRLIKASKTLYPMKWEWAEQRYKIESQGERAILRRVALIRWIGRVSPANQFRNLTLALSGADLGAVGHFIDQVKIRRQELLDYLRPKLDVPKWITYIPPNQDEFETVWAAMNQGREEGSFWKGVDKLRQIVNWEMVPALELSDLPSSDVRPERLVDRMMRGVWDLGALILSLGILLGGAALLILRYDVR